MSNPRQRTPAPARPAPPVTPPIASKGEAEVAIAGLTTIMDRLVELVTEETARAQSGRLRDAAALEQTKRELAHRYAMEAERVKSAKAILAASLPEALDALRKRHEAFQALLQHNLMVLKTAHSVSEGIIRGVSSEMSRKLAPSTYGATGRAQAPAAKSSAPMAVSRSL